MRMFLLDRPEVLLDKVIRGDQIGGKTRSDQLILIRKRPVDELPYDHIGDCE